MKRNKLYLFVATMLFVVATSAQDLISAIELGKIYKNSNVAVICASSAANYKVHIPGSVNIPHSEFYKGDPVLALIKSPEEMAAVLGKAGISADKQIIVYDEGSAKYAGRVYWILKYLGAPNVKMLDGNLKAWKAKRKPITGMVTNTKATTFRPNVNASVLTDINEVKSAIGNSSYVLVDARTPEEYNGTKEPTVITRPGHIPGAVNVNHETVLTDKGLLKSNEELKTLFESKGITPDKTVIVYCKTSVRAGIIFLALKGLGYPNVKVYDGAYYEWQLDSSNKVEK